ncbi:MAG TPA: type II secretion system F family protein [Anaerolineales bacterium]
MTAADTILIGALLLAGSLLLIRLLDKGIRSGMVPRLVAKIVALHEQATKMLIDRKVLRFPGIHLVPSLRGWFAGEVIFIATGALIFSWNPTPMNAFLAIILGTFLGGAAFLLSFREAAWKQIESIRSTLPLASFLLSLMLEAGMGSSAAMQEVVRALPRGPLSSELDEIARSRLLGTSRSEAIEKSRNRVPLDDYRSFLNLIQQGERLGIALSQALRELSSRMLENQCHRAETLAQKAAVKLLFPLVIFIFPSVFLIILSPVMLNLWELLGR